MIARLIHWSIGNRFLVLLVTLLVTAWGVWSISRTPVDARNYDNERARSDFDQRHVTSLARYGSLRT